MRGVGKRGKVTMVQNILLGMHPGLDIATGSSSKLNQENKLHAGKKIVGKILDRGFYFCQRQHQQTSY